MQRSIEILFSCVFLLVLTVPAFLPAAENEPEPIPWWQRPDYVVESTDVLTIEIDGKALPEEGAEELQGKHLVGPDGSVTLGRFGRVLLDGLKTPECEQAIQFHLTRMLGSEDFDVHVAVTECNSKEYHIVYQSVDGTEQRMVFSYTGHETLLSAIENCNGLNPDCDDNLLILRTAKKGKPVEMVSIRYEEARIDEKKNVLLKSGDTILIRQDFRAEQLRPDGPVATSSVPWEDLLPIDEEFDANPDEIAQEDIQALEAASELKMSRKYPVTAEKTEVTSNDPESLREFTALIKALGDLESGNEKSKRLARCTFFDAGRYPIESFSGLQDLYEGLKPDVFMGFLAQKDREEDSERTGYWLILFGEAEAVQQLHEVFTEISSEQE